MQPTGHHKVKYDYQCQCDIFTQQFVRGKMAGYLKGQATLPSFIIGKGKRCITSRDEREQISSFAGLQFIGWTSSNSEKF